METIKLNYNDLLICDPGYIKSVKNCGEPRFDALRCVEVLHDGDDGVYPIQTPSDCYYLGVDSGRIWKMIAEFGCEVEVDSGLSGHLIVRRDDADWGGEITKRHN